MRSLQEAIRAHVFANACEFSLQTIAGSDEGFDRAQTAAEDEGEQQQQRFSVRLPLLSI